MNDETYNGWTNRETWAAHLWITNDADFYRFCRTKDSQELKEYFQEFFDEVFADIQNGQPSISGWAPVIKDIGSLWRVNWYEIAEAFSDDQN